MGSIGNLYPKWVTNGTTIQPFDPTLIFKVLNEIISETTGQDGVVEIKGSTDAIRILLSANGISKFNGGNVAFGLPNPKAQIHSTTLALKSITKAQDHSMNLTQPENQIYTWYLDGNSNPVDLELDDATLYPEIEFNIIAIDITNTVRFKRKSTTSQLIFSQVNPTGVVNITFASKLETYKIKSDGSNWIVF